MEAIYSAKSPFSLSLSLSLSLFLSLSLSQLDGITTQKPVLFIVTSVKTLIPTQKKLLYILQCNPLDHGLFILLLYLAFLCFLNEKL
jgi:hypothetical protein